VRFSRKNYPNPEKPLYVVVFHFIFANASAYKKICKRNFGPDNLIHLKYQRILLKFICWLTEERLFLERAFVPNEFGWIERTLSTNFTTSSRAFHLQVGAPRHAHKKMGQLPAPKYQVLHLMRGESCMLR
jgi:hypothetical protein